MDDFSLEPPLEAIIEAIKERGGRALIVGGWVRDRLLGIHSKDLDFEVFGLELPALEAVLKRFGNVQRVGKQFGVLRVQGLDVDFSLPRKDNKIGTGHRGFHIETDPTMSFKSAALRRDLTVNSMGFDPCTRELLDPHGGQSDLLASILRPTSQEHFAEDPLRGLRAIQFAARLAMKPSPELVQLCADLDLSELPKERFRAEFEKWFGLGVRPSLGLQLLFDAALQRHFVGLSTLSENQRDQLGIILDAISRLPNTKREHRITLSLAAMGFHFEKEKTSDAIELHRPASGPWSPHHRETTSSRLHLQFIEAIGQPHKAQDQSLCWLQTLEWLEHTAHPELSNGTLRRLATFLNNADIPLSVWLESVQAVGLAGNEWVADLRARATDLRCIDGPLPDLIQGRDLIGRGLRPGPKFAAILTECRRIQDDEGIDDTEALLDRVLLAKPFETL